MFMLKWYSRCIFLYFRRSLWCNINRVPCDHETLHCFHSTRLITPRHATSHMTAFPISFPHVFPLTLLHPFQLMLFLIFFPSVPLPEKNLPIRMARGKFLKKKEVSQNKSRFRNFFFKKSIYFDEK